MSRVALAAYPDAINDRMPAGCGGTASGFWKTKAMIDFADADAAAASHQQRGGQPGLAYGIVLDGELVHAAGLGERHRGGQRDQVVHRDRDGGVVAVNHHGGRVADQQHRDTGVVENARGERVVGGEHGPLLAAGLRRGDIADGYPAAGVRSAVQRLGCGPRSCRGHGCRSVL